MAWFRRNREVPAAHAREVQTVQIPSPPGTYARPATPQAALALDTVYRCVALIGATVSQLPVAVVRGDVPLPVPGWLRSPDPWQLRDVVGYWTTSLATRGYLSALVRRTGDGFTITPVHPERVAYRDSLPAPGAATEVQWLVDGLPIELLPTVREQQLLGRAYLLHRPLMLSPDHPKGLGPLQAHAVSLGYMLEVEKYGADVYGNPIPQGTLNTQADITEDTATRYQDKWLNDPKPVRVLGSGLEFTALRLSPRDAAWLETRTYNAQAIARLFGVKPSRLGLPTGDSVTYATAVDNREDDLTYTISAYVTAVEDALSALLPRGRNDLEDQRVRLSVDALLRSSTERRYAAYQVAIAAGFLTVEEVRRLEGLVGPGVAQPSIPGQVSV